MANSPGDTGTGGAAADFAKCVDDAAAAHMFRKDAFELVGETRLSLLREAHLLYQRGETRIIVQPGERRVIAQAGHAGVVLVIGALEPFESAVLFTTPRVNGSDLKGRSGGVFRFQRVQRLLRFGRVTESVFKHRCPGESEGLVRRPEVGERVFNLTFL